MKFSNLLFTFSLLITLNSFTIFKVSANSFHNDNLQQTTNLVKANNKFKHY